MTKICYFLEEEFDRERQM